MGITDSHSLSSYVDQVAKATCVRYGIPERITAIARDVTERKFGFCDGRALDRSEQRRVNAYFAAVVRRTVARSDLPGARECRIQLMAAAVEADLRESGADRERVESEVAAWLAAYSLTSCRPMARRLRQRRVDEYTTDPSSRSNTHKRVLSRVPPSGPHASTTIQLAVPSTVAASA